MYNFNQNPMSLNFSSSKEQTNWCFSSDFPLKMKITNLIPMFIEKCYMKSVCSYPVLRIHFSSIFILKAKTDLKMHVDLQKVF